MTLVYSIEVCMNITTENNAEQMAIGLNTAEADYGIVN